ncbi:MAG: precorrin-6y C5,15-methyltransferase (decarboxylating) subunit CbiE [Pseudanabaenaceae cyanobacterium]
MITIVGIGEDGLAGLPPSVRSIIASAAVLVGGERHLQMVDTTGKIVIPWQKPIQKTIDLIREQQDRSVCILASGDPLWYGGGKLILQSFPQSVVIPSLSSFTLACARLRWQMEDVETLSLCGRPVDLLRSYLSPRARLLVLSSNGETPHHIAKVLQETGYDRSEITVLSHLGGEKETIGAYQPDARFPPLNLVAIECRSSRPSVLRSRVPGLPDSAYHHDGQLTKQPIRALTLSALSPAPGELLWDVGAGCGSIAIEWLRSHPRCRAIAIEKTRTDYIATNASALGVPHLEIVQGEAPQILQDLPTPDAIFIGGGITTPNLLATCWEKLPPWGRLVANAVTLESQALIYQWQQKVGGSLTRITIEQPSPLGKFQAWKPATPVLQWVCQKQGAMSHKSAT